MHLETENKYEQQAHGDEVLRALGTLEGKMNLLLERLPEHDRRLRSLEKFRNITSGFTALLSFMGALIAIRYEQAQTFLNAVFNK